MIPNQQESFDYERDHQAHNQEEEHHEQPQEKPIFFQSDVSQEDEQILYVNESMNNAVLDSGASKTVAREATYASPATRMRALTPRLARIARPKRARMGKCAHPSPLYN